MKHAYWAALALGAAAPAAAQVPVPAVTPFVQTISGTRLDVSATGEVSRVPDIAIISAGVMTRSASATGAISENAASFAAAGSSIDCGAHGAGARGAEARRHRRP